MVWVPGQAASIARSIMPGGMVAGTHTLIVIPPGAQVYSQPRWGWPCHQRASGGRISPARLAHSACPPAGSALGGASTVMVRAAAVNAACWRRRSHARPAQALAAAPASDRSGSRPLVGERGQQQVREVVGDLGGVGQEPGQGRPGRAVPPPGGGLRAGRDAGRGHRGSWSSAGAAAGAGVAVGAPGRAASPRLAAGLGSSRVARNSGEVVASSSS